jgi:autoinducer 2-degrading protein
VKPEHIKDFAEATIENHEASVKEAGNVRFDVLQSEDDPSYFLLYEAYKSDEAASAHKETPHYRTWRAKVDGWMAEPRKSVRFTGITP